MLATKEQITNKMNQVKEVSRLQAIARQSLYRRFLHTNLILQQMKPDFMEFFHDKKITIDKFNAIIQDYEDILQQLSNTELKTDLYSIEEE